MLARLQLSVIVFICLMCDVHGLKITKNETQSCSVMTDQGHLDLSSVSKSNSAGFHYKDPQTNTDIYWNPCKNFMMSGVSNSAEVFTCYSPTVCFTSGSKEQSNFTVSGDKLVLVYKSEYYTPAQVTFICKDATNTFQATSGEGTIKATLTGSISCLKSSSSNSSSKLSAGSVLLIIAAVAVVMYIVIGISYLKFAKKAEGSNICPNVNFWKDLPLLVKDGILFVFRGCKPSQSYEKM